MEAIAALQTTSSHTLWYQQLETALHHRYLPHRKRYKVVLHISDQSLSQTRLCQPKEQRGPSCDTPAYDKRPVAAILKEKRAREAQAEAIAQMTSNLALSPGVRLPQIALSSGVTNVTCPPSDVIHVPITSHITKKKNDLVLILNTAAASVGGSSSGVPLLTPPIVSTSMLLPCPAVSSTVAVVSKDSGPCFIASDVSHAADVVKKSGVCSSTAIVSSAEKFAFQNLELCSTTLASGVSVLPSSSTMAEESARIESYDSNELLEANLSMSDAPSSVVEDSDADTEDITASSAEEDMPDQTSRFDTERVRPESVCSRDTDTPSLGRKRKSSEEESNVKLSKRLNSTEGSEDLLLSWVLNDQVRVSEQMDPRRTQSCTFTKHYRMNSSSPLRGSDTFIQRPDISSLEIDALLDTAPLTEHVRGIMSRVSSGKMAKPSVQKASVGVSAKTLRRSQRQLLQQKPILDQRIKMFLQQSSISAGPEVMNTNVYESSPVMDTGCSKSDFVSSVQTSDITGPGGSDIVQSKSSSGSELPTEVADFITDFTVAKASTRLPTSSVLDQDKLDSIMSELNNEHSVITAPCLSASLTVTPCLDCEGDSSHGVPTVSQTCMSRPDGRVSEHKTQLVSSYSHHNQRCSSLPIFTSTGFSSSIPFQTSVQHSPVTKPVVFTSPRNPPPSPRQKAVVADKMKTPMDSPTRVAMPLSQRLAVADSTNVFFPGYQPTVHQERPPSVETVPCQSPGSFASPIHPPPSPKARIVTVDRTNGQSATSFVSPTNPPPSPRQRAQSVEWVGTNGPNTHSSTIVLRSKDGLVEQQRLKRSTPISFTSPPARRQRTPSLERIVGQGASHTVVQANRREAFHDGNGNPGSQTPFSDAGYHSIDASPVMNTNAMRFVDMPAVSDDTDRYLTRLAGDSASLSSTRPDSAQSYTSTDLPPPSPLPQGSPYNSHAMVSPHSDLRDLRAGQSPLTVVGMTSAFVPIHGTSAFSISSYVRPIRPTVTVANTSSLASPHGLNVSGLHSAPMLLGSQQDEQTLTEKEHGKVSVSDDDYHPGQLMQHTDSHLPTYSVAMQSLCRTVLTTDALAKTVFTCPQDTTKNWNMSHVSAKHRFEIPSNTSVTLNASQNSAQQKVDIMHSPPPVSSKPSTKDSSAGSVTSSAYPFSHKLAQLSNLSSGNRLSAKHASNPLLLANLVAPTRSVVGEQSPTVKSMATVPQTISEPRVVSKEDPLLQQSVSAIGDARPADSIGSISEGNCDDPVPGALPTLSLPDDLASSTTSAVLCHQTTVPHDTTKGMHKFELPSVNYAGSAPNVDLSSILPLKQSLFLNNNEPKHALDIPEFTARRNLTEVLEGNGGCFDEDELQTTLNDLRSVDGDYFNHPDFDLDATSFDLAIGSDVDIGI